MGGLYWVTAWYIAVWIGTVLTLVETERRIQKGGEDVRIGQVNLVGERDPHEVQPGERRFVRGVLYEAPQHVDGEDGIEEATEPVETEPTEITPLMAQQRRRSTGGHEYVVGIDNEPLPIKDRIGRGTEVDEQWWWALPMLVVIPLPALLMSQLQLLLLESLSGTLVDGSSPIIGEYLHVVSLMSHLIRLHSIWSGYALFDPDVHQHYALCSLSTS